MSDYTPGPWRVIDQTDVLALEGTPSSTVVASTKFFEGKATSWERANAQLVAAAPELLEALTALKDHVAAEAMFVRGSDGGEWQPVNEPLAKLLEQAEDAISKAEGRAS